MSGLSAALARIDSYRDDFIDFQRELVARPAIGPRNGGQGELERVLFLEERLASWGITELRRIDAPAEGVAGGVRPNLAVRLRGRRAHPAVVVLSHLDTVPPGELSLWEGDPFQLRVRDGRLYGRGTEDNGHGLTASLFALRALVEEELLPARDVLLLLVADEETGNACGIEYVLDAAPELVSPLDLVVVPDFGSNSGDEIEVAEKSTLWMRLRVLGQQVHASMPDMGLNSHRAAARLTVALDELLPRRFPELDPRFEPSRSTFEPTKREANVPNVNTIPGEDVLYFDCRLLPQHRVSEVREAAFAAARQVEADMGVRVEVEFPVELPAAPPTAGDAPVVRALSRALEEIRGLRPRITGIGGGTVAAVFRRRGVPAAVWATMDNTAHQANEYSVLDNLVDDAKVFAHLFLQDS